jgi:hypothetical protein
MIKYDIEIGEDCNASVCPCCVQKSCTGHGFIYKNDDAYAVYYAGWSNAHAEKKVSLALAIGKWDDDSNNKDRTCFGIEAYEGEDHILFRVIEPDESPWPRTDLMGAMLSRKESLNHPLLKEVFIIAEEVVRNHTAIKEYLGIPTE